MDTILLFSEFARGSVRLILKGPRAYWAWLAFLAALIGSGVLAYSGQLRHGDFRHERQT